MRDGRAIEGVDAREFGALAQGSQEAVEHLAELCGIVVIARLEIEFEAAGGADATDRRRVHDEAHTLAGLGGRAGEHAAELFRTVFALVPRNQRNEDCAGVGLLAAADEVEAADGEGVEHLALRGGRGHDLRHDLRHVGTGARDARTIGQRDHAEDVALVFRRDETPRNQADEHDVGDEDREEDTQGGLGVTEQPAHGATMPSGDRIETRLEPAEESVAVRRCCIARTQNQGAQRGGEG